MQTKKQICVNVEIKDVNQFQTLYPYMLSNFIRKAIKIANTRKDWFINTMYEQEA